MDTTEQMRRIRRQREQLREARTRYAQGPPPRAAYASISLVTLLDLVLFAVDTHAAPPRSWRHHPLVVTTGAASRVVTLKSRLERLSPRSRAFAEVYGGPVPDTQWRAVGTKLLHLGGRLLMQRYPQRESLLRRVLVLAGLANVLALQADHRRHRRRLHQATTGEPRGWVAAPQRYLLPAVSLLGFSSLLWGWYSADRAGAPAPRALLREQRMDPLVTVLVMVFQSVPLVMMGLARPGILTSMARWMRRVRSLPLLLRVLVALAPSLPSSIARGRRVTHALNQHLQRDLRTGVTVEEASALLHSAPWREVLRTHHFGNLEIERFREVPAREVARLERHARMSVTHPGGKMLVAASSSIDASAPQEVRLRLFFDPGGHFLRGHSSWVITGPPPPRR